MKSTIISVFAMAAMVLSGTVFASGFTCEANDGYNAKVFNNVNPTKGTRTPAALIISNEEGTLLVRKDAEIKKNNRLNTVQYVVEGSRKADADQVILQISFKEGREVLEAGDTADGQLILVKDGVREVKQVVCTRYLANQ